MHLCCIVPQFVAEEGCLVVRAYDALHADGVFIEAFGKIMVHSGMLLTWVL